MWINNLILISAASTAITILSGFSIMIDKYEKNYLIPYSNELSRITITNKSYSKIKATENKKFLFKTNNKEEERTINKVVNLGHIYEIYILSAENKQQKEIKEIIYFLEKKNYWSNIFNF